MAPRVRRLRRSPPDNPLTSQSSGDSTRRRNPALVSRTWTKAPQGGIAANSVVAFVVRRENPKHIHTWKDPTRSRGPGRHAEPVQLRLGEVERARGLRPGAKGRDERRQGREVVTQFFKMLRRTGPVRLHRCDNRLQIKATAAGRINSAVQGRGGVPGLSASGGHTAGFRVRHVMRCRCARECATRLVPVVEFSCECSPQTPPRPCPERGPRTRTGIEPTLSAARLLPSMATQKQSNQRIHELGQILASYVPKLPGTDANLLTALGGALSSSLCSATSSAQPPRSSSSSSAVCAGHHQGPCSAARLTRPCPANGGVLVLQSCVEDQPFLVSSLRALFAAEDIEFVSLV